ncbi:glycosyltransferase [Pseudogemmobacter sonorensis]|uniref:glycosyltransferase n=1 Tax=Pseudogemmobacter sonorensis TaxID=2989681 RepID=UPI0036A66410
MTPTEPRPDVTPEDAPPGMPPEEVNAPDALAEAGRIGTHAGQAESRDDAADSQKAGANDPDSGGVDPAALLAAPILFVTRFSFVGLSGWQSDASRDAEKLFARERLLQRLELFSTIALPSLAAQTDRDFHHLILTSDQLPAWAMEELTDSCVMCYGDSRQFTIRAEPPGTTRRALRHYMQRVYRDPVVVQVVLDDDDGLACDYVADLRRQIATLAAPPQPPEEAARAGVALPYFLSFPEGYGFSITEHAADGLRERQEASLYSHRYPFINCGLAMLGTPDGKNIFAIDHRAAPRKYGARLFPGKAMFLRSIHEFNDSRVAVTEKWQPLESWREAEDIRTRFPWLLAREALWNGAQGG